MNIEVEKRALLTKDQFEGLFTLLEERGAQDLGENNTKTIFYLTAIYQLKLLQNITRHTAKIAWKSKAMGTSANSEEIEVDILPEQIAPFDQLIQRLIPKSKRYETMQRRHDFALEDVYIALKYSDDWGYHLELDQNVTHQTEVSRALQHIQKTAAQLGLALLTEQEEAAHIQKLIAKREDS